MTLQAEMRLLALVDRESSTTGRIVKATFEMHATEAEQLRGLVGQRFGAALVQIGADEKPAEQPTKVDRRVQQAGILCNDALFQKYLQTEWCKPGAWHELAATDSERAKILLRQLCCVASRKELATNTAAADRFDHLTAHFELWRRG